MLANRIVQDAEWLHASLVTQQEHLEERVRYAFASFALICLQALQAQRMEEERQVAIVEAQCAQQAAAAAEQQAIAETEMMAQMQKKSSKTSGNGQHNARRKRSVKRSRPLKQQLKSDQVIIGTYAYVLRYRVGGVGTGSSA